MPILRKNFRLPEDEAKLFAIYADQEGRSQTELFREFIRSLKKDLSPKSLKLLQDPNYLDWKRERK